MDLRSLQARATHRLVCHELVVSAGQVRHPRFEGRNGGLKVHEQTHPPTVIHASHSVVTRRNSTTHPVRDSNLQRRGSQSRRHPRDRAHPQVPDATACQVTTAQRLYRRRSSGLLLCDAAHYKNIPRTQSLTADEDEGTRACDEPLQTARANRKG